jgi:hypothetical protein
MSGMYPITSIILATISFATRLWLRLLLALLEAPDPPLRANFVDPEALLVVHLKGSVIAVWCPLSGGFDSSYRFLAARIFHLQK